MRVNPLVVLLFNLILPICIMFPGNPCQHFFFLGFAALVLLLMGKFARLAGFAVFYGLLQAISLVCERFADGGGAFFIMFLVIMLQFVPCLMMASLLILDYTSSEIISALEPFHLPKSFVVALAILVRYVPTFKREFGLIRESMRLRGVPYTVKRPVRSFEFFLVPQLFRCASLADEITAAGLTRGITNPVRRSSYYNMKMRPGDVLLCAVMLAGMGGTILWR